MAKKQQFDVVVIGSGIAGMSYVTAMHQQNPALKIAVVTKNEVFDSNSYYAQGGIACCMGGHAQDSKEQHIQDTLKAGAGLAEDTVVREIVGSSKRSIAHLIEHGVQFDCSQYQFDLAKEGGHQYPRILHCKDTTGFGIMSALAESVATIKNTQVLDHHLAVDLIVENNEVLGVQVLPHNEATTYEIYANAVVLATGGVGQLYQTTSNPQVTTGDGIAMAIRAGALVENMAFVQFHPTIFYQGVHSQFLISEALRGEGAYLRCGDKLTRFMQDYDQENMELATRDVVAQAIFDQMRKTQSNYVYLDMRHKGMAMLLSKFPKICGYLSEKGLQLQKDLIPVTPGAHYFCGGIKANTSGVTSLKRLYAVGETACTGFHGANRLAGNSLLEGVHMGVQAARASVRWMKKPIAIKNRAFVPPQRTDKLPYSELAQHWFALRSTMQRSAGIVRRSEELLDLLKTLRSQQSMLQKLKMAYAISQPLIELENAVQVAMNIVKEAVTRQQSVGCHFRIDGREKHELTV